MVFVMSISVYVVIYCGDRQSKRGRDRAWRQANQNICKYTEPDENSQASDFICRLDWKLQKEILSQLKQLKSLDFVFQLPNIKAFQQSRHKDFFWASDENPSRGEDHLCYGWRRRDNFAAWFYQKEWPCNVKSIGNCEGKAACPRFQTRFYRKYYHLIFGEYRMKKKQKTHLYAGAYYCDDVSAFYKRLCYQNIWQRLISSWILSEMYITSLPASPLYWQGWCRRLPSSVLKLVITNTRWTSPWIGLNGSV